MPMPKLKQYKREPFTEKEILDIANRIKEIRTMLKLTGNELSLSLVFDKSYISQIEIATLYPTTSFLGLFYKIHNVNPNYILLGFEPKFLSNKPINQHIITDNSNNSEDILSLIDDKTLAQELKNMFNRVKATKKAQQKKTKSKTNSIFEQNETAK